MHHSSFDHATPEEILEAALGKETAAYEFYSTLLREGTHGHGVVTELLTQLKDEEYKHIRLIEHKLEAMRMGHDVVE